MKTTTTRATSIVSSGSSLGVVPKCTLTGSIKTFTHGGRFYCMVHKKGEYDQSKAMDLCKNLNSQLPLPKNAEEETEIRKIAGYDFWIGIRDLTRSGVKRNWKTADGKNIENAYVNLRVAIFTLVFLFSLLLILTKVAIRSTK